MYGLPKTKCPNCDSTHISSEVNDLINEMYTTYETGDYDFLKSIVTIVICTCDQCNFKWSI